DALDGAATLSGVEKAAVHQVFHGVFKVGVCPDVGGVFATEFQAHAEESSAGGVFHGLACVHRPREVHLLHPCRGNNRGGLAMIEQQVLEQAWRQVGATKGL